MGFSLVLKSGGYLLVVVRGLLIVVASLVVEQGLQVCPGLKSTGLIMWHIRKGNGTPFQYSCLENPMDGGAWWAAVHEVAKSQT